ncbi:2-C-methyl-D-erythritol 4-phosphate cytidylyltransferase [Dyadobacter sandarakinus]|uniref:2-C-methyl-D-erythritol 4-phosphate cytidylyltransferase n=1 Tax=Dyadobacter sandarakinus TaxID=2747268 RepID=A0ABX7ICU1_9BACT|nr:2-C-methyl-D-erythritol 4-phosphate cytidylyltransferase [Dyadobacter sandarakinus]QRR03352.1 2-C-methyl-D-erythritol 4-phosphate cytidylyltransferase [Dyadobacter sandarakinus]
MEEFVIIVAGGSGSRMGSTIPKQFLPVHDLPVLMHTLRAFRQYNNALNIILVLPEAHFAYWETLCQEYSFNEKYTLIAGGETRFHSVKNGLQSIHSDHALVAVHDGVRPVISKTIIANGFREAALHGTAVTSVPLKDSIRVLDANGVSQAMDRAQCRLVQTPQTFRIDWMRNAFNAPYQAAFTDCASVLESAGYPIHLIDGAYENIKITTPEDLVWAKAHLNPAG